MRRRTLRAILALIILALGNATASNANQIQTAPVYPSAPVTAYAMSLVYANQSAPLRLITTPPIYPAANVSSPTAYEMSAVYGTGILPRSEAAPTVGEVLTASPGTVSGSPTTYVYQWQYASGGSYANITGATCTDTGGTLNDGCTYTITSAYVGDTIEVLVTATNAAGSASDASAPTGVVTAGNLLFDGTFPASGVPSGGSVQGGNLGTCAGVPALNCWSGPGNDYGTGSVVGASDPLYGTGSDVGPTNQNVGQFTVLPGTCPGAADCDPVYPNTPRAHLESPELMSPTQNSNVYISIPVYIPLSTVAAAYGSTNNGFMVAEIYGPPYSGTPAAAKST